MKLPDNFPHYVTNLPTIGNNYGQDNIETTLSVKNYLDNLVVFYSEMSRNDLYRGKVFSEIRAVSDYLKRNTGRTHRKADRVVKLQMSINTPVA